MQESKTFDKKQNIKFHQHPIEKSAAKKNRIDIKVHNKITKQQSWNRMANPF